MAFPVNTNSNIRKHYMKPATQQTRLYYIRNLQSRTPSTCPFCAHTLTTEDTQVYCPQCGLVCQDTTEYVAGIKHCLPYGLRLG